MNHLIIGNKNYSSWSLRPWLLLKEKNIEFKETKISLYGEHTKEKLLEYSPAAKVPVYFYKDTAVWDSLAICETISELYPTKKCWPSSFDNRALARSISFEMHSGFVTIRNELPMNCRTIITKESISKSLQSEIDRICEIWRDCLQRNSNGGDFLFGEFSIADAMFAPIVLRFDSYGIKLGKLEKEYMQSILSLNSMKEWIVEALAETEIIQASELN